MAFKEWFRRLQPMNLYLVLFFTCAFFCVELIASHLTHSLTLLVNAYHMLCNIIALVGCIASIKYSNRENRNSEHDSNSKLESSAICISTDERCESEPRLSVKMKQSQSDRRMKNTFGWARINILTMLVCCVFLSSFCFSLQVEALQALIHIDHSVGMNRPLEVLCIGITGIFVNAFCYLLIGGYTFYHGSSLHVTRNGEVIIKRNVPTSDQQRSSTSGRQNGSSLSHPGRQGIREMCRDILGCVFVILVSVFVYYSDPYVGKFIDPVVAVVSSTSLFVLSYPYMKESGLILLQTIPNHININSLKKELLEAFPGIVNVHDLHVWQLTGEKTISTAHIMFLDPTVYANIRHQVNAFFVEMGITQVTIQPEFQKIKPKSEEVDCVIRCRVEYCGQSRCCTKDVSLDSELDESREKSRSQSHGLNRKFEKKEMIPSTGSINLKRFTLHDTESLRDLSSPENSVNNSIHNISEDNNKCITTSVQDTTTTTITTTITPTKNEVCQVVLVQNDVERKSYDKETV